MDLFNDSIATQLQYFTLPLELLGITLAYIELRLPKTAARITRWIERMATPIESLRESQADAEATIERSLVAFLTRLIRFGVFVVAGVFLIRLFLRLANTGFSGSLLLAWAINVTVSVIVTIVALVVIGVTAYFFVVGGSDFVKRFVAGRAIGTLGIVLASFGLLGEFYQFLALFTR
jgi:hypothetical protein